MAETSTPESSDPTQRLAAEFNGLQTQLRQLQGKAQLQSVRDSVDDLKAQIEGLPQRVNDLRQRKYAFAKGLEQRAVDLGQRWGGAFPAVMQVIEQQSNMLEASLRPVEMQLSGLSTQLGNPDYGLTLSAQVRTDISNLEGRVSGAESTVHGMYDTYYAEANKFNSELERIKWMLDQLDQASFTLLATEGAIAAVKATWTRDGREDKDDPQGVLYLTDQRLLFEQKQQVATKKVLFITTESKMVQQLTLDIPLVKIEESKASKQGFLKNEDFLDFRFSSGAPVPNAQFHIFGQAGGDWVALVNRARNSDFDKDRAIEVEKEAVEKVKAAPTQCPSCGGQIKQAVLRGMASITCEYCGSVIKL